MKGPATPLFRRPLGKRGAWRRWMADTRGASLVEYALMLFLVLCVAAATITLLGKKTRLVIDSSTEAF